MASSTREVITLQFGHYSNFVGTHWWNLQEAAFVYKPNEAQTCSEINHDILFREGINPSKEVTFTPRLVAVDLKGSLNTLKQEGELYEMPDTEEDNDFPWRGDVTMHKFSSASKNEFLKDLDGPQEKEESSSQNEADLDTGQGTEVEMTEEQTGSKLYNLDGVVSVWSDFLRIHLHPKSVHILDAFQHESEIESFDLHHQGRNLQQAYRHHTQLEDRLHFFLEEADHLQGFHVLVDMYDGFGGLASQTLEELQDDYGTKGILTMGLAPPVFKNTKPKDNITRLVNYVVSMTELAEHSSTLLPLSVASSLWPTPGVATSFPHLSYKPSLHYHTSAVLAGALETLTLPYRLTTEPSLLTHLTDAMTGMGRKVLSAQCSLPFPLLQDADLITSLMQMDAGLPWQPLSSSVRATTQPFCQSVVLRGVGQQDINRHCSPAIPKLLRDCSTVNELIHLYSVENFPGIPSACHSVSLPLKTVAPFPHIFSPNISSDGHLSNRQRSQLQGVESVPVMTSLQCSPDVSTVLHALHKEGARVDLNSLHRFTEAGLEQDNYTEALNSLEMLALNYEAHDMS